MPWKSEFDAVLGGRAHGLAPASILARLRDLDKRYPNIPEINFQLGWTCDILTRFPEAITFYEKAIALGLAPNELAGAFIGLGSCLRCTGQTERSAEVLRTGQSQFPDNREFDVFLAMSLHDLGRHTEAVKLLLDTLAGSSEDPGITAYQRAIRFHSRQLGNNLTASPANSNSASR